MKEHDTTVLTLVPKQFLDQINDKLETLVKLNSKHEANLPEYISEKDAIKLIGRGKTWFFEMRRSGKLTFYKVGSKVMYSRQQIVNFIEGRGGNTDE